MLILSIVLIILLVYALLAFSLLFKGFKENTFSIEDYSNCDNFPTFSNMFALIKKELREEEPFFPKYLLFIPILIFICTYIYIHSRYVKRKYPELFI